MNIDCGSARSLLPEKSSGLSVHLQSDIWLPLCDRPHDERACRHGACRLHGHALELELFPALVWSLVCGCFKVHHEQIMEQEASARLAFQFGAYSCGPA